MELNNLFDVVFEANPISSFGTFEEIFGIKKESLKFGDKIYVDIAGEDVPFCFEAVNSNCEFIFASENLVRNGVSLNDLDDELDEIECYFQSDVLNIALPCEHMAGSYSPGEDGFTNGRKIWIPSLYNMYEGMKSNGIDDVFFPRYKSRSNSRKAYDGRYSPYLLDTPDCPNNSKATYIDSDGYTCCNRKPDVESCICICFKV